MGETIRRFYSAENPIGKRFALKGEPYEIVGVVRDGSFRSVREPIKPCFYVTLAQLFIPTMHLEVRSAGNLLQTFDAVQRELLRLAPNLSAGNIRTLEAHRNSGLERERLGATILSLISGLALVLCSLGILSVLAAFIAERTPEIGLRFALGATYMQLLKGLLQRELRWVFTGLALGLTTSCFAARFAASLLFGVSTNDWRTYGLAGATLVIVALIAMSGPLARALSIDPATALRAE